MLSQMSIVAPLARFELADPPLPARHASAVVFGRVRIKPGSATASLFYYNTL